MNNEINYVSPFKRLCITVGNLPTAYIESMSYYEGLTFLVNYLSNNVIPAVNNNGEAVTELQSLFTELQNYVNNYFENLDVQSEIDHKLDEMVQDGTIETLLSQYVDPIINNFKTEVNDAIHTQDVAIANIDSKVDAATNMNPLVANDLSDMTDTSRIYVLVSTGNWYYYDGENWASGGVYQSTVLNDKSVHYQNLDDELQDSVESYENYTTYSTIEDGITNADGSITSSTSVGHYEITVNDFETYKLNISAVGLSSSTVCVQFLHDSTVISNMLKSDLTLDDNSYYNITVTTPHTCNKIRINTPKMLTANNCHNYINKVIKYTVNNINKFQLDNKLQSIFKNQYEEVTPTLFIDEAYYTPTSISSYASTELLSLEVEPNAVYRVTGKQVTTNPFIAFTTNNKIVSKTVDGNSYNVNNWVEVVQNETSNYEFENLEITIPSYCNKIYINHYKSDTSLKIEKCTSYKVNESDIIENTNKVGFSKIIAVGDSITEVNYRVLHNYLYWIKQDIPSLTIQNLGVGGTGYKRPGDANNTFVDRISSITSYDYNTDVILVMGSINDLTYVPDNLGSIGDTTDSTVYGSMYLFFSTLFSTYTKVRIGCISPINWKTSKTDSRVPLYLKALKETCELFSVPYLELINETNLRPENPTFITECYTADGTGNTGQVDTSGIHPNSKGHKLIYGRIKDFVNRL